MEEARLKRSLYSMSPLNNVWKKAKLYGQTPAQCLLGLGGVDCKRHGEFLWQMEPFYASIMVLITWPSKSIKQIELCKKNVFYYM